MAFGLVSARWLHWTACLLLAASQLYGPFLVPRTGAAVGSAFRAWQDGAHARLGTFARVTWALALVGHAAATAGSAGRWHLAVDAVHLAAASVWPGGLVCFALLLDSVLASPTLDLRTVTVRATGRFSASSLTAVAVLSATGLGNSLFFLHDASEVWTSRYGRLLAAKGFLFLGMLGFGAWNFLVLTRKLKREAQGGNGGGPAPAVHALLRNVLWEVVLGTVVILIVAVPGITEPPGR